MFALNNSEFKILKIKKLLLKNTHGTGCTLSSAITTFLSCGKPVNKSCELGIKYVNQAIKSNIQLWQRSWSNKSLKFVKIIKIFK